MKRQRILNIIRVTRFIKDNPDVHLREIARSLNMNTSVIHRTLQDIGDFITSRSVNEEIGVGLPNMPVFLRLKDGVTPEGILKFLNVKEKLEQEK
jgi:hypothetical protein